MSSLRDAYLKTRFSTRATAVALILIIVGVFCWRNGYNGTWAISGLLAIIVFIETTTRYPKLIATAFITLGQMLFITMFSLFMGLTYAADASALVNLQITVSFSLLLATVLLLVQGYLFSKGRLWVTLLVAYIVMNFLSFGLVLTVTEVPILAWTVLGYVIGALVVLARSFRIGAKRSNQKVENVVNSLVSDEAFESARKYLTEQNADFTALPGNEGLLLDVGKRMLLVIPVSFKYKPRDSKVDEVPIPNILSHISDVGATLSQRYHIPKTKTSVTVLDVSSKFNVPASGYETVGLKTKSDPVDGIRSVIMTNKKGLISYVGAVRKSDEFETTDVYSKTVNHKKFN